MLFSARVSYRLMLSCPETNGVRDPAFRRRPDAQAEPVTYAAVPVILHVGPGSTERRHAPFHQAGGAMPPASPTATLPSIMTLAPWATMQSDGPSVACTGSEVIRARRSA